MPTSLSRTVLESASPAMAEMTSSEQLLHGVGRFCFMFTASAALGAVSALVAALLFKHVELRSNPSLEFAMMLIFTYAPYGLAEGVHLSGEYLLAERSPKVVWWERRCPRCALFCTVQDSLLFYLYATLCC